MARRTATIKLDKGRDAGGVLVLEEMAALPACRWLTRAAQAMGRAGTNIPANIADNGVTAFLALGMGAIIKGLAEAPPEDVDRLLDQLMGCCVSYTAPGATVPLTDWRVIVTQIEEPSTFFRIQEEALTLMVGFSIADALSNYLTRGGGNHSQRRWATPRNVPDEIGYVLIGRDASLIELQTVYGMEDLFDMLEIIAVRGHNQHEAMRPDR